MAVDQLIKNLGDPRVAEKLRIYRLVEEQFALVESQVQKEVWSKFSCSTFKYDIYLKISSQFDIFDVINFILGTTRSNQT